MNCGADSVKSIFCLPEKTFTIGGRKTGKKLGCSSLACADGLGKIHLFRKKQDMVGCGRMRWKIKVQIRNYVKGK